MVFYWKPFSVTLLSSRKWKFICEWKIPGHFLFKRYFPIQNIAFAMSTPMIILLQGVVVQLYPMIICKEGGYRNRI